MESDRIHARAVIMREAMNGEDAPGAEGGWLDWLADCGIPAITGVDTRALVRHIRDAGAMQGGIFSAGTPVAEARERVAAEPSMVGRDLAREVTVDEPVHRHGDGCRTRLIALDTGIKRSIIRNFTERGVHARAVPVHDAARRSCSRSAPTASSSCPARATRPRWTTSSTRSAS